MIQAIMLIALGFLVASLIGVLLAPSLWSRAYRLSRKRLEKALPLSLSEIEATQDQLRASYAVRLRRLETALASAKQKAAIQLVDNSRLQMQIVALKDQIGDLDLKLGERRNAANVLEQTITKRFPELDREITAMKAQLQERSYELQDLTNKLGRRDEELSAAERAAGSFEEEVTRLRQVLEKSSTDRSGRRLRRASQWGLDDYRSEYDRLNLELSKLRQQLAQLQDRDAQQTGVIKGELQKLAELILVSAQPKAEARPAERSEPASRRIAGPEPRRDRPMPWPAASSAPVAALRPETNEASQQRDLPPAPVAPAPQSSLVTRDAAVPAPVNSSLPTVLKRLPEETVLNSGPKNEAAESPAVSTPGTANARSRILLDVTRDSQAFDSISDIGNGERAHRQQDLPGDNPVTNGGAGETERKDARSSETAERGSNTDSPRKESGKAFADARDLQSLSELVAINASNGASHPQPHSEPKADPKFGPVLDLEPLKSETEERGGPAPGRTLLDRLKGIESVKADK